MNTNAKISAIVIALLLLIILATAITAITELYR